jgi:DNA-binding NtrC family response regulator
LIVHAGGERRWRRIEFWPIHDAEGDLTGVFGMVREADAPSQAPDSQAQRLRAELAEIRDRLQRERGMETLIGAGAGHRRLLDQVRAAAASTVPVLIVGEPGTGKRTVARTIHARSERAGAPLLPFDCAALPPEVLERELFGTGIDRNSPRLLAPSGATVLLLESLELPRDLQGLLASLSETGARLVATSAQDVETARSQDRVRGEFYYMFTALVIRLRPLRDRADEITLLAQHFLERTNFRHERRVIGFDASAIDVLCAYDWPGNLRELARVIEAAHERATGDLIRGNDLPAGIRGNLGAAYTPPPLPSPVTPLDSLLTQLERRLIEQALGRARQNKSRAAELLDISRPRLYRRIKELNIPDEPEAPDDNSGDPGPGLASQSRSAIVPEKVVSAETILSEPVTENPR